MSTPPIRLPGEAAAPREPDAIHHRGELRPERVLGAIDSALRGA